MRITFSPALRAFIAIPVPIVPPPMTPTDLIGLGLTVRKLLPSGNDHCNQKENRKSVNLL